MDARMRVAVITVSDSVSRGEREDASGPLITDWARAAKHEIVSATACADETVEIVRALTRAADSDDAELVLTTGGTTIIELAKALPPELSATFITVSLPVAYEYIHHPNIEVIFIGDKISKSAQISVGGEAISKIRQIKADLCFLGTNAIDIPNGLTDSDWDVVQIKKAMIESSEKVISLTIAEKLNSSQRIKICQLSEIDVLITELNNGNDLLKPYHETGIEIL